MFRHILVGLDGSEASKAALRAALRLASESPAEVWVLSVEERLPHYAASVGEVEEAKREMDAFFDKLHKKALSQASAAGVKLHTAVRAGHAAAAIVGFAQERGVDLIVVGGHRRGLGGTADRVVEQASCSVLVVRETPMGTRVDEIMASEVATVGPETAVSEVVELLIRRGIKAVPVTDSQGHVVGIITGGDLIERGGLRHRLSLATALDQQTVSDQLRELARGGQVARDVMTPKPLTVPSGTLISVAARWMAERKFKRLPVVDGEGRLMGIVSRLDVLRALGKIEPGRSQPTVEPTVGGRSVKEFMGAPPPMIPAESPAADVVARLSASPYRRVGVVDEEGKWLGLITDREVIEHAGPEVQASLLKRLAGRTGPLGEMALRGHARDMMIKNLITVSEDAPIMEALMLMMQHHVKRIPVMNRNLEIVGIVDRDAVLRAIAGEI